MHQTGIKNNIQRHDVAKTVLRIFSHGDKNGPKDQDFVKMSKVNYTVMS